MANTVKINIQAKSNLAQVLSATTKAANATYASLKRLNGIKLPNYGAGMTAMLKQSNVQARQFAQNYSKADTHARKLYESQKAMNRLKRPAWQTTAMGRVPVADSGSGGVVDKKTLERNENFEVNRALLRQQKEKATQAAKHQKAMETAEKKREKERDKHQKEQTGQWKKFSTSFYRVQSLMDRLSFFGSIAANQLAFPLFGGMKGFAEQSYDAVGSTRRLSMQLGMTAGDIQNFGRLVQEQGGRQEDANEALSTFHDAILKAAKGDSNALRIFNMSGTPFMNGNGQVRATAEVLREYLKNSARLANDPRNANYNQRGRLADYQSVLGRGGDYLYTGIRGPEDYNAAMGRRSYAPTDRQQAAWSAVQGQVTESRLQLQQKAYEFLEKNKEWITDTIKQSQWLANKIIAILGNSTVLSTIKWAIAGVGGAFMIGGIASVLTNFTLAIKGFVLAIKSGGAVSIARGIVGLGPATAQSAATKGWLSNAAGNAAGGAIGGNATAAAAAGSSAIALIAVAAADALIVSWTIGKIYDAVEKYRGSKGTSTWLKNNASFIKTHFPNLETDWSDFQSNGGGAETFEERQLRLLKETPAAFMNWMNRDKGNAGKNSSSIKIDLNVHNKTGNQVDAKVSSPEGESTTFSTNLFNYMQGNTGSAPLYA